MTKEKYWNTLKKYSYLAAFMVPVAVMCGVYMGGVFAYTAPFVIFVILPLLDVVVGEDESNYSEEECNVIGTQYYYRAITWAFVPIYYVVLLYAIYHSVSANLSLYELFGNIWSMGIFAGFNIVVAHELGHKQNRFEKTLAKILLHGVCYGHFMNEHNKGHHAQVATPDDPASARFGESFYKFFPRTVVGTFKKAFELESDRLARMKKCKWHISNEIYRNVFYPVLIASVIYIGVGCSLDNVGVVMGINSSTFAVLFFFAQAALGFSLLEIVNYIEHYGLVRKKMANGRYERVSPIHSWNSNHLLTNCVTYHLQRHSDHHTWPSRRYQTLRNFPESPQLPTGYAGMVLLAAIPPLWFLVMNPRVKQFMARQDDAIAN
jgi:alkane 1-monooxygenase